MQTHRLPPLSHPKANAGTKHNLTPPAMRLCVCVAKLINQCHLMMVRVPLLFQHTTRAHTHTRTHAHRKQKAAEFSESEETSQIESRARELDEREKVIIAKEKQLMERERECKRLEGLLSVEGEALSASIKVKREKLEDSKVLTAQMQDVLQQRLHQLQLLSG
jgi:hypothetical protein